jgi:hypothetical protein
MNSDDVISQAEAEQVLTFDIPDDVLEQTASAEHTAFTVVYCTNTATCPTSWAVAHDEAGHRYIL